MKRCYTCGVEKEDTEFYKDNSKKDGLTSSCKDCRKSYHREYRQTHKDELAKYGEEYRNKHHDELRQYGKVYREIHRDELLIQNREYQSTKRKINKQQLYDLKTPCVKCGENRPYVIDFHHINPVDKRFNISTRGTHYSVETVKNEISKCVCLCRNCHIEFHHFYGNTPLEPVKSLTEYLGRSPYEI